MLRIDRQMGLLLTVFMAFFLFPCFKVSAQVFGGNPTSLRWKQIKTDSVRVIFTAGQEKIAQEMAGLAGSLGNTQYSIGNKMRPISIVLQHLPTISNGYVGLAPKRSEFYLTAEQNSFELGSLPWYKQLMLHEFRHVQQYNNFKKGLSKLGFYVAGEAGLTLMNSTAIPNWFWEGDAVFQETKESKQGRGRLPNFFNGYRSLWSSGKNYSWQKLRNGSLRDYVPDHYQLGYLMTSYGREKFGDSIWAKVTDDAVRFRGLVYPFQQAIKRRTGLSYVEFRKQAQQFFSRSVPEQMDSASSWAAKQAHFAGEIAYPQWMDRSRIIYVKSNYKQVPAFTIKNTITGEETRLRTKDISLDAHFSFRKNFLVYAARSFDPRWGWREYNDIRLVDIGSGRQYKVTSKSRYFSPDLSMDEKRIVAVDVKTDGKTSLDVIGVSDGAVLKTISHPEEFYYTYPRFFGKDHVIAAVRDREGQMAMVKVNLNNGEHELLVPFTTNVIGFPMVKDDTICFSASFNGRDRNFAFVEGKLFKMEIPGFNEFTGSYQPSLIEGQLAWVDFTASGQKLSYTTLISSNWQMIDTALFGRSEILYSLSSIKKEKISGNEVGQKNYEVKKYSSLKGLLNFHSWIPYISDPEYTVALSSENILNTFQSELYATYNTNDESKRVGMTATYGGLFPWIRIGGSFIKDRKAFYNNDLVEWDEWEARVGFLLPLNFSGGKQFTQFRVGSDYVMSQPMYKGLYKDTFSGKSYSSWSGYMLFNNQVQKARMHIYPHFAQNVRLEYHRGVTRVEGHQFLVNGQWYFPGIGVNHSLVINTAIHVRDTLRRISFNNAFPFSRGYIGRNFHQMLRLGLNYHMPLLYPDLGVGQIIYFQRVRSNVFYDFTRIMDYNTSRQKVYLNYRSAGAEIFFDTKWWNQQPISFGFRYSRLLDAANQGLKPDQFEFVLPVSLINR